jgi:hypothetical protein
MHFIGLCEDKYSVVGFTLTEELYDGKTNKLYDDQEGTQFKI